MKLLWPLLLCGAFQQPSLKGPSGETLHRALSVNAYMQISWSELLIMSPDSRLSGNVYPDGRLAAGFI